MPADVGQLIDAAFIFASVLLVELKFCQATILVLRHEDLLIAQIHAINLERML